MIISQDYFDEVCLETMEFMDDDEDGATAHQAILSETLQQLELQQRGTDNSNGSSKPLNVMHLTLTVPNSTEGIQIRTKRRRFLELLSQLKTNVSNENIVKEQSAGNQESWLQSIKESLKEIETFLATANDTKKTIIMHRHLFRIESGVRVYLTLWNRLVVDDIPETSAIRLVDQMVETLLQWLLSSSSSLSESTAVSGFSTNPTIPKVTASSPTTVVFVQELQKEMPRAMAAWLDTCRMIRNRSNENNINTGTLQNLLTLAYWACRHCESNKEAWIKTTSNTTKTTTLSQLLVQWLESEPSLVTETARLVTVLCTFDEFHTSTTQASVTGSVVQASHVAVTALSKQGIVPALYKNVVQQQQRQERETEAENVDTQTALFAALRSLAIQDDVVQSMTALGITKLVSETLVQSAQQQQRVTTDDTVTEQSANSDNQNQVALVTAVVGLARNLCANDSIKSTLCHDANLLSALAVLAERYTAASLLQQHVCGMVGAMALRQPQNAELLVNQAQLHLVILQAMQQHAESSTLQRQAALAIRNLVARSPQLRPVLLEAQAEHWLYQAAAKHASVQDEVYAALRDLGKDVRLLRVEQDNEGNVQVAHTAMFGETKPNFRPVFD